MIRIGVIGYGNWGPRLAEEFATTKGIRVVAVSDLKPKRLQNIVDLNPDIKIFSDFQQLLNDQSIDAVAIATPVCSHYPIAMAALHAGKHVWVEKPMATEVSQCEAMIEEAERRNLVLFVDHICVYTGSIRRIKQLIDNHELGKLYYYDSVRANLGRFQPDVNVIWDLAVHDLSIINFLFPRRFRAVSATGMSHIPGQPENTAFLTIYLEDDIIAHINVNWLAPIKIRQIMIGGDEKMVVYNDLETYQKIKIYDSGVAIDASLSANGNAPVMMYRAGDIITPQFDRTEALSVACSHFAQCVENKVIPYTGGYAGMEAVRVLEAATYSLRNKGLLTELE